MPILGGLERVRPAEAVALARSVLARFGRGAGADDEREKRAA
jgi:hypothetical protein